MKNITESPNGPLYAGIAGIVILVTAWLVSQGDIMINYSCDNNNFTIEPNHH